MARGAAGVVHTLAELTHRLVVVTSRTYGEPMGMLDGKIGLVTGAASGIGKGIAVGLAEAGADVAMCDISPAITEVAAEIATATGRLVDGVVVDVRDADAIKAFVDAVAAIHGGLDIVVANAGVWKVTNGLTDSWDDALDDWDRLVGTNLRGVYVTGRAAMPHLVARGGGHLVNVATDHICPPDGFATGGGTFMDVYDSSKWGINGLTQAWSKLLAPHGVRVNALCMDAVVSGMSLGAAGHRATPEVLATWMQPAQIAALLLDLIAEGPGGRTGENIGSWRGHSVVLPPRVEVLPRRHA